MKRQISISMTRSGLSVYAPEELRQHVGSQKYSAEMERMADGTSCLRLYPSARGRSRFHVHGSTLHPLRLVLPRDALVGELATSGLFGSTPVVWTRGSDNVEGEIYISVPAPDQMMATITRSSPKKPRQTAAERARAALRTQVSTPAFVQSPHERLKALLRELNQLMHPTHPDQGPDITDVELTTTDERGQQFIIRGPIKGRRTEEFG